MLPGTSRNNWRFSFGFFDKISLIYEMRRQATVNHLCSSFLSDALFPGGECPSESMWQKEDCVFF